MADKRLLLISNGFNFGGRLLGHAEAQLRDLLGERVRSVLFVPYAAVTRSFDEYAEAVRARFAEMGYALESVHGAGDPVAAVARAEAIAVGGGNTFHLLRGLYEAGIVGAIRARAEEGVPYVGWSAGSNVACPTIRTTNDMPIVEPPSFDALGLVPFQINPHYTDAHPEGHKGETREERLLEFVAANPGVAVVGLREGTMLRIEGARVGLSGDRPARVFAGGGPPQELGPADSFQSLLG